MSRFVARTPRAAASLGCLALVVALGSSCGGGGGGGGGQSDAHDLQSVTPSPVTAAKSEFVGSFAADFLRDTYFTTLVVEVDYAVSTPPSAAAIQLLHDRLAERCKKPDGVVVIVDDAIADTEFPASLDVNKIEDIEDAHRDMFANQGTGTAVLYLLYLLGASTDDVPGAQVLGLSYRAGSCALFMDAVGPGNVFVTAEEVEGTGIVHEAGHLLGLVDGGCPSTSSHKDALHAFHCSNTDCVMYWQIMVPFSSPNIGDSDFATLGPECIDDLQAFGGN